MRCPACGSKTTNVVDSRPISDNQSIRRRRECPKCNHRFTTYEEYEDRSLKVIKKSRKKEIFDKGKILKSLDIATYKRDIAFERLEEISNIIENELKQRGNKEVESREIGELVMEKLLEIDKVAYVRYASVYKKFKEIDDFKNEVQNIK